MGQNCCKIGFGSNKVAAANGAEGLSLETTANGSPSASKQTVQAQPPAAKHVIIVQPAQAASQATVVKSVVPAPAHNWGYEGDTAPAYWCKEFPHANGKHQSPVDLQVAAAIADEKLQESPLKIAYELSCSTKLLNNGHTFVVSGDSAASVVTGGPATLPYRFLQFHMHWGPNDACGSEHTIDGKPFAAELHFVNWNSESFKEASQAAISNDHSGMLVLGVLLTIGNDNPALETLIGLLKAIKLASQTIQIAEPLDINQLLPDDKLSYFHYLGSLTTPPCTESVKWIVFKNPIQVSSRQLNEFRNLHTCSNLTDCCEQTRMTRNYRPVCQLNDRKVYKSFI